MGDAGALACPGGSRAMIAACICADLRLAAWALWVQTRRDGPAAARAGQGTRITHAVSNRAAYMHAAW